MKVFWGLIFVCACGSSFQEDLFDEYDAGSTQLEASSELVSEDDSAETVLAKDARTETIIESGNEVSNSDVSEDVLDSGVVCNGRMCPVCGGNKQCCAANGACGCAWDKCYPLPE